MAKLASTITVQVKYIYGNKTIYPVCDTAKFFCRLSMTKTLTPKMVDVIKAMGITIQVQGETL